MGLRGTLRRTPSPSGLKLVPPSPSWYDPLTDKPSWAQRQDRQRRHAEQHYYSSYHNSYAPVYPNAGGGAAPNISGESTTAGSLYNEGWLATSVPCPNCGNLMLEQQAQQVFWCSTCCQKTTRQALHEKMSRTETALEWLSKQIAKYTAKK